MRTGGDRSLDDRGDASDGGFEQRGEAGAERVAEAGPSRACGAPAQKPRMPG